MSVVDSRRIRMVTLDDIAFTSDSLSEGHDSLDSVTFVCLTNRFILTITVYQVCTGQKVRAGWSRCLRSGSIIGVFLGQLSKVHP